MIKTKFRKVSAAEILFFNAGFVSNRHWIFSTAWILSLTSRTTMGLRNRIKRDQLQLVTHKMQGTETRMTSMDIGTVVNTLTNGKFRVFPLSEAKSVLGYKRGKPGDKQTVAMQFGRGGPAVDIEYFAALQFDAETEVRIAGPHDPILIYRHGAIVGLIGAFSLKGGSNE